MKKFLLTNLLLLGLFTACNQEMLITEQNNPDRSRYNISLTESKSELIALLSDLDKGDTRNNGSEGRKISSEFTVTLSDELTRSSQDSVALHIFNFEDNQGYAIMSGDNRLPSLIALTENGNIDPVGENEVNDGLGSFYENLNATINNTIIPNPGGDSGLFPDLPPDVAVDEYYTYGEWENIVYDNGATCPVKWGQLDPYNRIINANNGSQDLYVGCTTVGVAQLMAVHKYPPTYNKYRFDWNLMTRIPLAEYADEATQNNIARLMEQLGLPNNLDAHYGTERSGAKFENIPRTLKSMGYTSTGIISDYDSNKVVEELKKGYPLLLVGYSYKKTVKVAGIVFSTTYSEGHVWLAHGLLERKREVHKHDKKGNIISSFYESIFYPRYNWGWDALDDGYFLTDIFNTKDRAYPDYTRGTEGEKNNFQFKPRILYGVRK